ncbi:NAD-binding protein [Sanghuangporus baumii]|uniref:NAD-binding protein n=1 Tax=Sanghuangporus baumii TaxID=108892 RepID=A0A9Q5MZE5_SANBA|nr:NAD-binding protein [Sanghuangporus baumii]
MVKQSVLVIGATGATGSSIVDGLLESGNFAVIAGVRPSSAEKPEVEALKSRGVEIRIIDLDHWTVDQIAEQLKGVDTVISAVYFTAIPGQKLLADACKKADVKRFVPDDWATACVRGVRSFHDQKLAIHDYVKEIGIDFTFIDVGWWMQVTVPFADPKFPQPIIRRVSTSYIGSGDVKCALIDKRDIGKFVARIIADDRTLNQYVFCWTEEFTLNETIALAERVSGRKVNIEHISADEMEKILKDGSGLERILFGYEYSIWIRGDNTVENAKKKEYGGALDARELYPDIGKELRTMEDFAKECYSN